MQKIMANAKTWIPPHSQSTALGHKIMVQASCSRDVMLDRYVYETRKTELHINEVLMVKNTNI